MTAAAGERLISAVDGIVFHALPSRLLADSSSLIMHHVEKAENDDNSRWPGWKRDRDIASHYASRITQAFHDAIGAVRAFFARVFSGQVRVTPSQAAQESRDIIARSLNPVMASVWTEGYALGRKSAEAVIEAPKAPVVDDSAWGWEPGDADAAAKVADGPRLEKLLNQWGVDTIKAVSETKLDGLAEEISKALEEGQSPGTLARRIEVQLQVPSRAKMIARTELARAVTAGALDRYEEDGIDRRDWLVAPDEKACKICRKNEADGAIPMSQAFSSGVMGPPGHPNCRCSVAPASVHGFDLTDMFVEPLPGFNVVPMKQPAMAGKSFNPSEPRDAHGKWARIGQDAGNVIEKNTSRFAEHGSTVSRYDGISEDDADSMIRKLDRMSSIAARRGRDDFRYDTGVGFTRHAVRSAAESPDTTLLVAHDSMGHIAGALAMYEMPTLYGKTMHVDWLGSTGTSAGSGTKLVAEAAKIASGKGLALTGIPSSPESEEFWQKIGWQADPMAEGAGLRWGWTARQTREVAQNA